ncbi:MAG TPA: nucleotidyltransferase family protein, partial [Thermodesulfobacteriota bacterium]
PLVGHALAAALASGVASIPVVLGHAAEEVAAVVSGSSAGDARVRLVVNPRHAEGQGTSVAAGARAVPTGATGVLFLLADQPLVRAPLLDRLLAIHQAEPDRVLVPTFEGRRGNPVLFPADLLPALAGLSGERGGRAVLEAVPDRVALVETADPAVVTDVDTAETLAAVEDRLAGSRDRRAPAAIDDDA